MNVVDSPAAKTVVRQYIEDFIVSHGYAPSFRQIARECGIGSTSTVRTLLQRMRSDGMIDYEDNIARSLSVSWR